MRHPRVALAVLAVPVLLGIAISAEEPSEVPWLTSTPEALQAASDSGRPLLVDLWAVWCQPCKLMEQTTYRDPEVLKAMEGFVPLKVDIDANPIFIERYGVDGYPTTLFLDSEGRELTRVVSMVGAEEMLAAMQRVGAGYGSYLDNLARGEDPEAGRAAASYLMSVGNPGRAADLLRPALKEAKKRKAEDADRVELELAEATLADGRAASAAKTLERLSSSAADADVRGHALLALVRAEQQRGRDAEAKAALERLRREHPDLAANAGD